MAQVAHIVGICILPDQGVVLPHDAGWAGLDTVWAINVVGTLDTVVWSLNQGVEKVAHLFLSF